MDAGKPTALTDGETRRQGDRETGRRRDGGTRRQADKGTERQGEGDEETGGRGDREARRATVSSSPFSRSGGGRWEKGIGNEVGAGEDGDDDVVERLRGSQQEACVEGAAGDVDKGSPFGDVA